MRKKTIAFALTFVCALSSCNLLNPIRLNGPSIMEVEVFSTFEDPGVTYATGVYTMTKTGEVDVNTVGSYELTYAFTNSKGVLKRTITRLVNVVDKTAPTYTLTPSLPDLYAGFSYPSSVFVTATDNYDAPGDIIFEDVTMRKAGLVTIEGKMYDTSGNETVFIREVSVTFDGYKAIENAYDYDTTKYSDTDESGTTYREVVIDTESYYRAYASGDLDYKRSYSTMIVSNKGTLIIASQYGGFENADLTIFMVNSATSFYAAYSKFNIHSVPSFGEMPTAILTNSAGLTPEQVGEFVNAHLSNLTEEMIDYYSNVLHIDI